MSSDTFGMMFVLHHVSGDELFAVRMRNRRTGRLAFRLSRGGEGGNRMDACVEEDDESVVYERVFRDGWAIRASTKNCSRQGLYKLAMRTIVSGARL